MNCAHVIRLHTTQEHETYFRKACGVARHAYTWALARWKEERTQGKRVTTRPQGAVQPDQRRAISLGVRNHEVRS